MIADLLVEALILVLRAVRSVRRAICGALEVARLTRCRHQP